MSYHEPQQSDLGILLWYGLRVILQDTSPNTLFEVSTAAHTFGKAMMRSLRYIADKGIIDV